ncbi:MAG: tetratricopeptide repeat protein [Acidobacteria bacterium]|nr:tetratricopeptide repeat protein [Acidobacteriota bacterium]
MQIISRKRRAAVPALTLLVALCALQAGCRGQKSANPAPNQTANAQQAAPAAPEDIAQLDADIDRLEKQAERNPADEETQDELARVYVRRAKAEQGGGRYQEALTDYQRALRHDPDNEEAQGGAAAMDQQLGGDKQEDENGAPAPLPITPNVADEEGKPAATPTPKKGDK